MRTGGPETESYSLLNGRVAYKWNFSGRYSATFFCKVDNITATKYETIYGFPMPRATAMAGIDLKF